MYNTTLSSIIRISLFDIKIEKFSFFNIIFKLFLVNIESNPIRFLNDIVLNLNKF